MEPLHPIVDPAIAKPSLKRAFAAAAVCVALLWLIRFADAALGLHLVRFGVHPGALDGLAGILFAPLIHGSWSHLFANTPALLVLGTTLLYGYPRAAGIAVTALYLGSGLGVWLFARDSYHIGASGLTHGMLFFIFTIGILRRDRAAIALSLLVFFLYGGMVWSVLPQQPGISFESHFFGAVTGVALAFLLRNRDPKRPERRYEWEDEPETGDDPGVDDERKR